MNARQAKNNVAKTAHLTAWVRSLGRLVAGGDAANADYLAERFLLPYQRALNKTPRATRWLLERAGPGAFGYFNARTRYFDEVLGQEAPGIAQLVLLGAGFDSRPQRFADQLERVRVFEVDMPQVLSIRAERLRGLTSRVSRVAVPIDFDQDDLAAALAHQGFSRSARTLFLWEGVAYYLPVETVEGVLSKIASLCEVGSSIVFDYVTHAFFSGDHSSYGASALAAAWRRLGNVNRSGVKDVEVLLQAHGFQPRAVLGPRELQESYVSPQLGTSVKVWGPMRIVRAVRV